ncbi:MAG: sodium:proton antiporter [Blautia sp.]|nr:sodium:proton antiporter [Blautia sp.]
METLEEAYRILYTIALTALAVLIGVMVVRSVIGPRVTDRILSINMVSTMTIASIAILSRLLGESYLTDIALIYAMISFITVLIFGIIYIPAKPKRDMYYHRFREDEIKDQIKIRHRIQEGDKG